MNPALLVSSALLIAALDLAAPSLASAEVLLADDFETGSAGGDINGKQTAQGAATWSAHYVSAILKYQTNIEPSNAPLGAANAQFWANPNGRGAASLSTDLSAVSHYSVDIGYLWLNGIGAFGINARSVPPHDSGYWFARGVFEGGVKIRVSWKDAGREIPLGYLPVRLVGQGLAGSGISIRVAGESQRLYVDGAPFDTESRPAAKAAPGRGSPQVRIQANASPASPIDIRLDNLSVVRSAPGQR